MNELVDRIVSGKFVLIAEIGVNYYDIAKQQGISNMDAAKLMCLKARDVGIHAVKFQTYKAETLSAEDSPSYWDTSEEPTRSQRELFKKYDSFGEPQYRELADYCSEIGISFFSTPFDYESADYLEPLMDVYKISSSDLTNHPFIEYQAKKNKPIIMSVGAGDFDEIRAAVEVVRSVSSAPLVVCHCVLEYPTPYDHANLSRITTLRDEFPELIVGYSDHCRPDSSFDVVKTAYVLGARVIEKHFTLDKSLAGNDHYHAMDPVDARNIIEEIDKIDSILGDPRLVFSDGEALARLHARRSIVSSCDIPKGQVITEDMLTFKRPGSGIPPYDIDSVLGRTANHAIPEDTVLQYDMLNSPAMVD